MNKQEIIAQLNQELKNATAHRQGTQSNEELKKARYALKTYQSSRLRATHADLLADPQTRGAAEFFLTEIYGAKDSHQRDNDLTQIIPIMEKTFPQNALEVIAKALTLDALTERLDTQMAQKLGEQFTPEQYKKAFCDTSFLDERLRQLSLVKELGYLLCNLVRIPFLGASIKMMRLPARLAGVSVLHDFLEQGFTVFKATPNPQVFVDKLLERENQLIHEIFSSNH